MKSISIPFDPERSPRELLQSTLATLAPMVCENHPNETLELNVNATLHWLVQDHRLGARVEYEPCTVCPFRTGDTMQFFDWYQQVNGSLREPEFLARQPSTTCALVSSFRQHKPDFGSLPQPTRRRVAVQAMPIEPDAVPNIQWQERLVQCERVTCGFATACSGSETPLALHGSKLSLCTTPTCRSASGTGGESRISAYQLQPKYFSCPACSLADAGVPPIYLHSAFDRFKVAPPEIAGHLGKCREYAATPRGVLLLRGTVGSGKTYLAVAIARNLLRIRRSVFITHADFLRRHRLTYGPIERSADKPEDILHICQAAPLLIFDDLGRRQAGRDEEALLFDLFNHRYEHHCPTVITTNLAGGDFENFVGTALFDRLRQACFASLEFNFPSKRPGLNHDYLSHGNSRL